MWVLKGSDLTQLFYCGSSVPVPQLSSPEILDLILINGIHEANIMWFFSLSPPADLVSQASSSQISDSSCCKMLK